MRNKRLLIKSLLQNQQSFKASFMAALFIGAMLISLAACSSSPAVAVTEPVNPDKQNAVVYFFGYRSDKASIWDGEKPIGDFAEGPRLGNIPWKTKPGEHYFMANTFNWVVMKANLQANKTYYVKLDWIPNPIPFAKDFIAMRILDPDEAEWWLDRSKSVAFPDDWRSEYAQGDRLQEAKEQLQKARSDKSMKVDLK